jgi:hypothetical protein
MSSRWGWSGDRLSGAGYDVVMLGGDITADALGNSARRYRPAAVCISSTLPAGAARVLGCIEPMQRQCPGAGFLLGGRGPTMTRELRVRPEVRVYQHVSGTVEVVDALVNQANFN